VNCAGIVRCEEKTQKNKSEYEENLGRTSDRTSFVIYKTSLFSTVHFFVSKKIELYGKNASFSIFVAKTE
jgi:hypothetical protein